MDTTAMIIEAAAGHGALGSAMVDLLARSSAHFGEKEVNAESVQAFLTELKTAAPHLFEQGTPGPGTPGTTPPAWLPAAERMSWVREHAPQAPVVRRPQPFTPSEAQLRTLEGKSGAERMTLFRQWQAEAAQARR